MYLAVLTENYFVNLRADLEYLQSRVLRQAVVDTHVDVIVKYLLERKNIR